MCVCVYVEISNRVQETLSPIKINQLSLAICPIQASVGRHVHFVLYIQRVDLKNYSIHGRYLNATHVSVSFFGRKQR